MIKISKDNKSARCTRNVEVARLWVEQELESATNGRMRFEGDTMFSFNDELARIVKPGLIIVKDRPGRILSYESHAHSCSGIFRSKYLATYSFATEEKREKPYHWEKQSYIDDRKKGKQWHESHKHWKILEVTELLRLDEPKDKLTAIHLMNIGAMLFKYNRFVDKKGVSYSYGFYMRSTVEYSVTYPYHNKHIGYKNNLLEYIKAFGVDSSVIPQHYKDTWIIEELSK